MSIRLITLQFFSQNIPIPYDSKASKLAGDDNYNSMPRLNYGNGGEAPKSHFYNTSFLKAGFNWRVLVCQLLILNGESLGNCNQ